MADPEYIPMPGPGEFTTTMFVDDEKRCCLLGWAKVASGGNGLLPGDTDFYLRMQAALAHAAQRHAGRGGIAGNTFAVVSVFNDVVAKSDEDRAAVWREAAAELGYVEVDE